MCIEVLKRGWTERVHTHSLVYCGPLPWRGKCRSRRRLESVFWESALMPGIMALYFCVCGLAPEMGSGSFLSRQKGCDEVCVAAAAGFAAI